MEGASLPNTKVFYGSEFYCNTVQEIYCGKIIHDIGFEKDSSSDWD